MNCPNCSTPLSCGCQKKVGTDGKTYCVKCIPEDLVKQVAKRPATVKPESTAPTNVKVLYKPPRQTNTV